jgi:hypothetical protein
VGQNGVTARRQGRRRHWKIKEVIILLVVVVVVDGIDVGSTSVCSQWTPHGRLQTLFVRLWRLSRQYVQGDVRFALLFLLLFCGFVFRFAVYLSRCLFVFGGFHDNMYKVTYVLLWLSTTRKYVLLNSSRLSTDA